PVVSTLLNKRRAAPAPPDHQRARSCQHPAFAQNAANKTFAVKHVTDEGAARAKTDRVARTRDLRRGHDLIQQWDSGHLVRHGDKRAMDIGKLEYELEKGRVVLGFAAHRNDNCVNVVSLEI